MKKCFLFLILASFLFGSVVVSAESGTNFYDRAANGAAFSFVNNKAPGFVLKDQNDKSYAVDFPRDKVTVLIFGDREGSDQVEGWVRPIYDKYKDKVEVYGIAELSAVPGLARGVVRRIIKSRTKYSVLLDWNGNVSEAYGYQTGKATVVVVGKDGKIIARRAGAASQSGLNAVYKEINSGL